MRKVLASTLHPVPDAVKFYVSIDILGSLLALNKILKRVDRRLGIR